MDKCKPLAEYAWFIDEIRNNRKQQEILAAVRDAIKLMPDDFLLKKFLVIHAKEVEGMLEMDYDEEEIHELFREEGREEGRKEERINTERERKRADAAESEIKELKAEIERLRAAMT